MKLRPLLLLAFPVAALAQDGAPPIQIPPNLFFDTDFVVVEPQNRISIGVRTISGAQSSFGGAGYLESTQLHGEFSESAIARGYHDGAINRDARTRAVDDGAGNLVLVPIEPDGKTNNWQFLEQGQVTPEGNIELSTYQAQILEDSPKSKDPRSTYGVELTMRRDMFRTDRMSFTFLGGVSLHGLTSSLVTTQDASVTKLTDTYSLDGTPPPDAPYPNPPFTIPVVDSNGFPVSDGEGQASTSVDTVVNIEHDPESRETTTELLEDAITNRFDLRGAYFTFRAGPTVEFLIGSRFQAMFSAGAALAYAGTTYSVQQDFDPETGPVISETVLSNKNTLLPGFYADASVEMTITERAGLYLGAVYQNTGDFRQTAGTDAANYSTNVSLKSMQGVRAGMNVRF